MAKPTTVWRIPLAAWPVIGLAVAAESVSNALRAYGLGTHLDRFTIQHQGFTVSLAGAVLVLASVAVSLSQARAAWITLTPGPARQRIIAGLSGVLLLAISVTAMASHILEAQRVKVAEEGTERSKYDRARAAYDRVAAELRTLTAARTMAKQGEQRKEGAEHVLPLRHPRHAFDHHRMHGEKSRRQPRAANLQPLQKHPEEHGGSAMDDHILQVSRQCPSAPQVMIDPERHRGDGIVLLDALRHCPQPPQALPAAKVPLHRAEPILVIPQQRTIQAGEINELRHRHQSRAW